MFAFCFPWPSEKVFGQLVCPFFSVCLVSGGFTRFLSREHVFYKIRVISKKITIRKENRARRCSFCRQKLTWTVRNNWCKVIFSDETRTFMFGATTGHKWLSKVSIYLTEFILPLMGMIVPTPLYVIQPLNIAEIVPCFSLSDIIPLHKNQSRSWTGRHWSVDITPFTLYSEVSS
jgi:hypothetical protein